MSIEDFKNPFLRPIQPEAERRKNVKKPEIIKDEEYSERKKQREGIIFRILDGNLDSEGFKEEIKKIIAKRKKRQETYLRKIHQKSDKQLKEEYNERYENISNLDFLSDQSRKELSDRFAREVAYYELNPDSEWRETEGEEQERKFARGAIMQKHLSEKGLNELGITNLNLDPDKGELSYEYSEMPEKIEEFSKEDAKAVIENLFTINNDIDGNMEVLEKMKARFGINEVTTIVEDIFDSFEGYRDNMKDNVFNDDYNPEELPDGFKEKALMLIDSSEGVFERYQNWDKYYFVNDDLKIDNLSKKGLPISWDGVGVTNNFLNALIKDYGKLRIDIFENCKDQEALKVLDNVVLNKFKEMGDEEAGETVVKLAILRFSTERYLEKENEEKRKNMKSELIKIVGE